MLIIKVEENKGLEKALKQLKNKVRSTKMIENLRKRKEFTKPSDLNREKRRKAAYVQNKFKSEED